MPTARIIICEKHGDWAMAWRAFLHQDAGWLWETRSLVDCERALARFPASLVALEGAPARAAALAGWMDAIERNYPQVRFLVMGPRSMRAYEGLFREAGALAVVFSPRQLGDPARWAQRHLSRAPQENLTLIEQIEEQMPWQAWASGKALRVSSTPDSAAPETA